ncbi:MAG: helix-turn-helix domain-containing protein [Polyangia bacterium]
MRWRRRSWEVINSDIVAGRSPGPEPPAEWLPHLHRLVEASRSPVQGPAWWTPLRAYDGNVETRTDPATYYRDGMRRLRPHDPQRVVLQLTLSGWGHFELYRKPPVRLGPGTAFIAVIPSRHRYYLPEESPGWTFAWVRTWIPHIVQRFAKQVSLTGPVLQLTPSSPLVSILMRLVRGAFEKDFRDRFELELALFELLLAYERAGEELLDVTGNRERLLEWVRARVLARPRQSPRVDAIATERGMSRSHFSHFFHNATGMSPARFMTEVRVQEAARMLIATRAPLKHIADAWGFATVNHFCRVFRRLQHTTPAAYRRSFGY